MNLHTIALPETNRDRLVRYLNYRHATRYAFRPDPNSSTRIEYLYLGETHWRRLSVLDRHQVAMEEDIRRGRWQ